MIELSKRYELSKGDIFIESYRNVVELSKRYSVIET